MAARSAYSAYKIHQQELKKVNEEDQLERKWRYSNEALLSLKYKKQCFESDIKSLEKDANNFTEIAETERNLALIIKSNSLKNSVKEKKKVLEQTILWGRN